MKRRRRGGWGRPSSEFRHTLDILFCWPRPTQGPNVAEVAVVAVMEMKVVKVVAVVEVVVVVALEEVLEPEAEK